jgi:hypothetical protein
MMANLGILDICLNDYLSSFIIVEVSNVFRKYNGSNDYYC